MDAVVERIESVMNSKTDSPHCLMELSRSEAKILENNMITLGGLSYKIKSKKAPKTSSYKDIKFVKGCEFNREIVFNK